MGGDQKSVRRWGRVRAVVVSLGQLGLGFLGLWLGVYCYGKLMLAGSRLAREVDGNGELRRGAEVGAEVPAEGAKRGKP